MTGEEFIKELDKKGYSYEIEGDKIVITYKGLVDLKSLTSISPGVVFNNRGDVDLGSLIRGWIDDWSGNIEGIDSNRLLNLMINKGLFER